MLVARLDNNAAATGVLAAARSGRAADRSSNLSARYGERRRETVAIVHQHQPSPSQQQQQQ